MGRLDQKPVFSKKTGFFVARDNRFRVTVEVDGRQVKAHLANSGRLGELLTPGRRVVLAERPEAVVAGRTTGYDLALVEHEGRWVSVDARLPNELVAEALAAGRLAPLAGYATARREVSVRRDVALRSRFDFLLEAPDRRPCLLEIKSVTLVLDGLGCFPDAVTARGRRHVEELAEAVEAGYRAAVVFVVQRDDAVGFRPHDESDPEFAQALRDAARRGVEVYAYACWVEPGRIEVGQALQVYLEAPIRAANA